MKLRVVLSGVVAGIFPFRLTPVDQEIAPGAIVKKDIRAGIFRGTAEIDLVDTSSAQSVALMEHPDDPEHTLLVTNTGQQISLSPAAMWQLAGAAPKRSDEVLGH